jgi:FtsZ-interacting cell division protein ZipA
VSVTCKSNSNTIFILSLHVESFSHVESHFCTFNSNTTLYFVFIFIKIIFSLFYFNFFSLSSFFFSLSSFLFSSLCSRPTANPRLHHHAETKTQATVNPNANPYPRQTHGNPYPRLHHHAETKTQATVNPTPPENPNPENPSHRQKIPTPRTQATVNPENRNPENPSHQKISTPKPKPTNKPNPTGERKKPEK